MVRWISIVVVIVLLVVATYWLLQREGIESCQEQGRTWDYSRWTCSKD